MWHCQHYTLLRRTDGKIGIIIILVFEEEIAYDAKSTGRIATSTSVCVSSSSYGRRKIEDDEKKKKRKKNVFEKIFRGVRATAAAERDERGKSCGRGRTATAKRYGNAVAPREKALQRMTPPKLFRHHRCRRVRSSSVRPSCAEPGASPTTTMATGRSISPVMCFVGGFNFSS